MQAKTMLAPKHRQDHA